jgi:serine/threonine-protein kinase RsbW
MELRLLENGLDKELTSEICLVVAEALNNVVEHAYRYAEDGDIEIDVSLEKLLLTIEINDFGPQFNIPLAARPAEVNGQELANLPEGGFGWNLIMMLTDEVSLERRNNRNYLTLTKKLAIASSQGPV